MTEPQNIPPEQSLAFLNQKPMLSLFNVPFSNMWTQKYSSKLNRQNNVFIDTVNQMFSSSSQLLTIAKHGFFAWTVLDDFITAHSAAAAAEHYWWFSHHESKLNYHTSEK